MGAPDPPKVLEGGPEQPLRQADLMAAAGEIQPSSLDWLRTARNLVRYAGDTTYKDVEAYLRTTKVV